MNTLILDAALGTQLAVNGEELPEWKNSIWSAHALIYKPKAVLKIHLDNIEAGADVLVAGSAIFSKNKSDYSDLIQSLRNES